jgi:hypothetical protein
MILLDFVSIFGVPFHSYFLFYLQKILFDSYAGPVKISRINDMKSVD